MLFDEYLSVARWLHEHVFLTNTLLLPDGLSKHVFFNKYPSVARWTL